MMNRVGGAAEHVEPLKISFSRDAVWKPTTLSFVNGVAEHVM